MARLVLELLDEKGTVRMRERVTDLPATIGRSVENDLIVDDPYVCAHHARIVEDESGALHAEDLGSVNGLRERRGQGRHASASERASRIALRSGSELLVGRTRLRVRRADESMASTLREPEPSRGVERVVARFGAPVTSIVLVLAFIATVAPLSHLSSYERFSAGRLVGTVIGVSLFAAAWAGGWALASRMNRGVAHFRPHVAITCGFVMVFVIMFFVESMLNMIAPGSLVGEIFSASTVILAFTGMLGAHLAYSSAMRPRRRWSVAGGVVLGLTAFGLLFEESTKDDFSTKLEYSDTLLPLDTRLLLAVPPAEFVGELKDVRRSVDELAEKKTP